MKSKRKAFTAGLVLALAAALGSGAVITAPALADANVSAEEESWKEADLEIQEAAEEESRRAAEEAASKAAAEEESRRAAEEAASKAAAEEESRRAAEEAASKEAAEEESRRAAEEAASKAAAEEESRRAAEEAASKAAAEEESRRAAEEAAAQAAAQETAAAQQQETQTPGSREQGTDAAKKDKDSQGKTPAKAAPEKLSSLPCELKAELPEALTAGTLYTVTLEVTNATGQAMEKAALTLTSEDDRYVITAYKSEQDAQDAIDKGELLLQKPAQEPAEGETDPEARVLKIRRIEPGETIKADLVLLAREDIQVDAQGLKAAAGCDFQSGGQDYTARDTWKLTLKESEEEPPTEEPTPEEPSTEEPETGEQPTPEEPSTEEPETGEQPTPEEPSTEEPETGEQPTPEEPSTEEPETGEQPTPEEPSTEDPEDAGLDIQDVDGPTEPVTDPEDETVVIDVIPDDKEGEDETAGDEQYWDDYYSGDWYSYSGVEAEHIDTATPYVLIKSYGHKKTINTGDTFALEITFLNTSQKIGMENVLIKVETSDALSLANGTNTLFINGIGAGETSTQRINLLVGAESKDPTQKVDLGISFEYIDNKERKQGEASESITIPVTQKDRLEVQEPVCDYMQAGQEGVISVPYVNKGFSSLYNMQATLSLEGAEAVQNSIYAGNVESGNSGTLDFVVTPLDEGDYEGTVTLTYEDAAQKEVSIEVPVRFTSTMAYEEEPMDFYEDEFPEEPEEGGLPIPLPWMLAGGGAVVLAVIIIAAAVHRKKKARKAAELDADDWFNSENKS